MRDASHVAANKRRLSSLWQRAPWLLAFLISILRLTRARFTAGVVGVVCNADGAILVVEHVFHAPETWGLPGGWMGRREAPRDALRRELHEELGLIVSVLEPVHISQGRDTGHLDMAFLCRAQNDVQYLSGELMDYRWVDPEALPPLPPFHRAAVDAAHDRLVREDGNV